MSKLPRLSSKKIIKALSRAGFYVHHQTGSHINLRHLVKKHLHVVIPFHKKDLALKTLKSIISQTELTLDEFINLI